MAELPNLTQFFGPGPVAPPDGVSTDPALDFSIPSAWDNPDLHDQVVFTLKSDPTVTFALPPLGTGKVEIKTPWKVKIDPKGGAGKAKPKQSKTGGEATKDKCKIECIDEAWPYILAAARKIIPGSGPWKVSHPSFDLATIHEVEIESWTDAPKQDAHGFVSWEFTYSEISPQAQSGNGGGNATSTPDSKDAQRTTTVKGFGGNDNVITIGADPDAKTTNPNSKFSTAQSQASKP